MAQQSLKEFILDLSSLSVQIQSNVEIEIDKWLAPFLISNPYKRNIQIKFFFGIPKGRVFRRKNIFYCFVENNELKKIRQALVLIRNILSDLYLEWNLFMVHASAVLFKNKSLLFIGKSDEGKTTIAKTLLGDAKIINDECLMIHKIKKEYWVSSYPLNRNKDLINNIFAKIDNVFFIKKSKATSKLKIQESEAMKLLREEILPKKVDMDSITPLLLDFLQNNNVALLEHYPFDKQTFIGEILR